MINSLFKQRMAGLQPYAAIFIRLAFGYHLIQYTFSDVINLTAGSAHFEWLGSMGVPMPYFMSWLFILTEFIGGIALVIGFKIRLVAILLIINFIVAYFLVHFEQEYLKSFEAIQMLAVSLFFLFHGSGKLSIDNYLESRTNKN